MNDAVIIPPAALDLLTSQVTGPVATPADQSYGDETFAWNLGFPQTPAVAVGATNAADVQAAVRFAAVQNLPVAVLATGHGVMSTADQAVLINVRRLRSLQIDPEARTATVGAGVEWQEVVSAAGALGLAPVSGSALNVGVVGYTLGGGLSPVLGRRFGWAADHVRAFDIVTADGELRTVTAQSEPDLFWAVRGGKSNFGVVVSLTFSLMPVPRFYGGGLYFDAERADPVLSEFRRLAGLEDDRVSVSFAFLRLPPAPFVPEPLRGKVIAHLRFSHLGTAEEGEALLAPVRAAAPALIDLAQERPYTEYAVVHNDPVDPLPAYERTTMLTGFPPEAAQAFVETAGAGVDTPVLVAEIRRLGGALGREPEVANAIGHRDAPFTLWLGATGAPGDPAAMAGPLDALLDALAPWKHPGAVLNFLSPADADPAQIAQAYSPAVHERLLECKLKYDPLNRFRVNHVLIAG
ncbi:FAD-binding oxidoreductase [Kineosporia rhizophila]|uniref:FAD-binding oxidoreductase n=1 Tax=Kineosporia rhizophila TaxID=84633 RepID=UPI001E5C8FD3|nr:FAD-binding oxidoreductase [Kineosporia rhizophila]MCE0537962.1 FAD-binding oxidoreductase [Kineosporia rhizophila]